MATTPDRMMYPSALERRFLCPGSARVEAAYPYETEQSPAAAEGTMLHAATMQILMQGDTDLVLTDDQRGLVDYCVAQVLDITGSLQPGYEIYYELKMEVDGRKNHPRIDVLIVQAKSAIVIDFKFGSSATVHPGKNWQMRDYAVSVWQELGAEEVRTIIMQPKEAEDWRYKEYTFQAQELEFLQGEIADIIERCLEPDAPLVPGKKQCQWCRASEECEARKALVTTIPKHLTVKEHLDSLDATGKADLYEKTILALSWVTEYKEAIDAYILAGGAVEGWEIGEGKPTSKWAEDVDIIQALTAVGAEAGVGPEKLVKPIQPVGITEARKVLGNAKAIKDMLDKLIEKKPGKPTPVRAKK